VIDARSDAELAGAYLAGDHSALGAIYDRYADRLHDTAAAMLGSRDEAADAVQDVFVTAAERLGQLRDRSKLRAWLFAILRHDVYRRCRRRRRDTPAPIADLADLGPAAVADAGAEGSAVIAAELADDVRAAARGLEPRDQLVLELSVRQGLRGQELADALGVSGDHAAVLLGRMRERVERSLGALAVVRHGRRACRQLDALVGAATELDVRLRKRVAHHIESCSVCGETSRRTPVFGVIAAAPLLAAPATLRDRVLRTALGGGGGGGHDAGDDERRWQPDDDGFPRLSGSSSRRAVAVFVAGVVVVLVVLAAVALTGRSTGSDPAPPASSSPASSDPASSVAPTTIAPTTVVATTATVPTTTVVVVNVPAATTTTMAISHQTVPPVAERTTTTTRATSGPTLVIGPIRTIPFASTTTVVSFRPIGVGLPTTTIEVPR